MSNQSCPSIDFQQPELQIGPSQTMISSFEAPQDQILSSNATSNNNAESLKGPAPSLEVFANFKDLSPLPAATGSTVLRSERKVTGKNEYIMSCTKIVNILTQALGLTELLPIAPATVIHRMKYALQDCKKQKKDVNKGQPIPPEDLIDLTSSPEDDSNTASFFDLPKSQTLKQPTKKNHTTDEAAGFSSMSESPIGKTSTGELTLDNHLILPTLSELPHPSPAVNETCAQMATPNISNSSDNNSAAVTQTASTGSENLQDKGASSITSKNANTQTFSLIKDEVF
ncbi:hypothetical protein BY996DRAFT_6419513 [Phakopsora pachyrhizi]|nr:hypothetical protein BY996DRAFT_6419513 [Phakopsora pachyrhizi]